MKINANDSRGYGKQVSGMEIPRLTYKPKQSGICCTQVQRSAGYAAKVFHTHDHHEISLITGQCTCQATCNGNSVTVRTPALVLMKAGSFHEIVQIFEGQFSSRVVFFHPQLVADIPDRLHHTNRLFQTDCLILPLTTEQQEEFLPLFALLENRRYPENLLLLLSILCHLQAMLDQGSTPVLLTAQRSFVFDIIERIQAHPEKKYAIAELAQQFHVSQTKLKTDFKRIVGMPVNAFCRQVRLQKALALMETTTMTQAQIAYACGFSDESHFIDAFRGFYARTPGEFRQQMKLSETAVK